MVPVNMGVCQPFWFALGAMNCPTETVCDHRSHTCSHSQPLGSLYPWVYVHRWPARSWSGSRMYSWAAVPVRNHGFRFFMVVRRSLIVPHLAHPYVSVVVGGSLACLAARVERAGRWHGSPCWGHCIGAGYVGGFCQFITPSGLRLREGSFTSIWSCAGMQT